MADTQHRVAIRMAMDGALEVKQGLRDVGEVGNREMGKLAQGAQVAQRAFSLLGPVLAGISVGALANFAKNAVDTVGGLGELADAAGVSTDALQALGLAATQTGLNGEELQRALAALTRKIADAATGEQTAATAFQRLGIAFQDAAGNARPTEAVLTDLADKLQGIENPAERAAAATAMFGDRIGQRMIPLLAQGREGLIAMTAEALRFGAIASPELIAKADEAADKVAALTASFTAFANNMLANVAPAISSVIDGLNRLIFGMTIAERRAQLEGALSASERRIEALQNGSTGLAPGRRNSIRPGLVGAAQGQTGETVESLLAEERQRLAEIQREIEALNQQEERLRQRAEAILNPESRGGARAMTPTTVTAAAPRAAAGRDPWTETLREQQSLLRANETAYERYQRQLEELAELQDRLTEAEQRGVEVNGVRVRALSTEELARATERFATELQRAERQTERTDLMGRQMGMSFSSAFEDAILKGKRFSDILKALEQDIARIILRTAVTGPAGEAIAGAVSSGVRSFAGSFTSGGGVATSSPGVPASASGPLYSANGNAFAGGHLIPFANGGVVSSPTMFPMAQGMGLMGEAGPEAIMPLQRGVDGKLGVRAQGGGQDAVVINQSITIDARGADPAVDQKIRLAIAIATEQAQAAFLEKINRGGNVAKAVGRR
jgi:hypothetical protein